MKNIVKFIVIILALVCIILFVKQNCSFTKLTQKNIEVVKEFTDNLVNENKNYQEPFTWDAEWAETKWKYYNGFLLYALLKTEKYDKYVNEVYNYMMPDAKLSIGDKTLDSAAPAFVLFYLPEIKDGETVLSQVYNNLQAQPRLKECGNNYYHKINSPNWKKYVFGLDGLYMVMSFELEYTKKFMPENTDAKINDIYNRLKWVHENLKTPDGLYFHGAMQDGKPNHVVWLRALGWYAMAQTDIIELLPEGEEKEALKKDLAEFFDAVLSFQDSKCGMWKNVPDAKINIDANKFETSGTLMLSYALLKSYYLGFVSDEKYADAGLKAFNGTVKNQFKKTRHGGYVLDNIYISSHVYDNPDDYCMEYKYTQNDAKGIAPLILSSIYAEKVLSKL